jgi:hypothetical protein
MSMPTYLTPEQLEANLSVGKSVEQWLGHQNEEGYT